MNPGNERTVTLTEEQMYAAMTLAEARVEDLVANLNATDLHTWRELTAFAAELAVLVQLLADIDKQIGGAS